MLDLNYLTFSIYYKCVLAYVRAVRRCFRWGGGQKKSDAGGRLGGGNCPSRRAGGEIFDICMFSDIKV